MQVVLNLQNITTKDYQSSVSPKGQITLPKELRDILGVTPKTKVTLRLEDGALMVTPVKASLESIYQSVPALGVSISDHDISDIANEEHAEEAVRENI